MIWGNLVHVTREVMDDLPRRWNKWFCGKKKERIRVLGGRSGIIGCRWR